MQSFRFHPVIAQWFEKTFGSPTEPQLRGWPAIQAGGHTLIAAPTGSGKTLAAFFAELDLLFREGLEGTLRDETRVVYVSPLKALSNDIHKNLEEPLAGIRAELKASAGRDVEVRGEVRTGDTPASKRQAIARKPPHILVTTPESLYLLLTSVSGRKMLSTVRTLIVDEIHAVVANRRGSHLALSMERLEALVQGPLQRIGLSATQKPITEVARFLVGCGKNGAGPDAGRNPPDCTIVDAGFSRRLDLAIELPGSPLEAVMSHEVWAELYNRLAELIQEHRTTLIFVNTRRMAERVTHQLGERIGKEQVTSHHGSLSAALRLDAENRLKTGKLRALVATASLELGIDIGSVELVCQLGPTRSIATLLQRVGRAEHKRLGVPKGRLFPLSRDELVECLANLRCLKQGQLDQLHIPDKPLDVLAQQIVASVATQDWTEDELFSMMRGAYPYRNLTREEFQEVVRMLAEGFSTKRGRRAALIHHDLVNHRVRARRGSRLIALTSGGAIPDNGDYRVVLEPTETFIGTVNEDFAIESLAGDIFQLGNASWKILRVNSGQVRVEDAQGQPPTIPFWLGEAPGRTNELSAAVSELRADIEQVIRNTAAESSGEHAAAGEIVRQNVAAWLTAETGVGQAGARQLADYFVAAYNSLGVIPSRKKIVLERFFDESGGMQLVVHSPYGILINRAWGLALRKRFCRSFNFELQAAATDDAIVLSLGTQHSFPLEDVFRFLHSNTVRDILIQALLDAPMFPIRWRWNATRALALPRQRGGRKIPAPLQRMESENLLAAVFPDQLACLENIAGDREVPDHPLVRQSIEDCLTEAMDINGLISLLKEIENGEIECIARDLPEPSPLAHEILNAKPYAFLDDAPLEERRTHAVLTRRATQSENVVGILDAAAIDRVAAEAWPRAVNVDELHEALLLLGAMTEDELKQVAPEAESWAHELVTERRSGRMTVDGMEFNTGARAGRFWVAAERLPLVQAIYEQVTVEPSLAVPEGCQRAWERADAVRELLRGRMEVSGPVTANALADLLLLKRTEVDAALLALEAEGFVLRGKFHPGIAEVEWCDRRLLARIHRLTINRLRAEIQPVSIADFQRFLLAWQRVDEEHRVEGPDGLEGVLELLDGYDLPAGAWEPEVLSLRVKDYSPQWLDQLCFMGRIGWGRLTPRQSASQNGRPAMPLRTTPISLFLRANVAHWLELSAEALRADFSPDTNQVLDALVRRGALFFGELTQITNLLPSRVELALAELAASGLVTSDSFEGLRALLMPAAKRFPFADVERKRRHKAVAGVERAGRWSLLRHPTPVNGAAAVEGAAVVGNGAGAQARDRALELFARTLLLRYGVVFRRMLDRETFPGSWFELGRVYRRLEARGEIRGGYFVSGVSGEQFALPEAIGMLRSLRKGSRKQELITISGVDPLNLVGILTPGPRITANAGNRILFCDGAPIAALEADKVVPLSAQAGEFNGEIERTLRVGKMPVALRPYYA
jgi:ATP-dependent Lhr-like helicase